MIGSRADDGRGLVREAYRAVVLIAGFYALYFAASTWAVASSVPFVDPISGLIAVFDGPYSFFARLYGLSLVILALALIHGVLSVLEDSSTTAPPRDDRS